MNFHLAYNFPPFPKQIDYKDKLLLIGSCFTENMYEKLMRHKFQCLQNPHGILFNPVSIKDAIKAYTNNIQYTENQLVYLNEAYHSWAHHSRFSHPNPAISIEMINAAVSQARDFLQQAKWVLLTFGSAWGYELKSSGNIVANCHKAPAEYFKRRLLSLQETNDLVSEIIQLLKGFNPELNIILTISPVRHLREGFVENNRSKATLIHAVHAAVEKFSDVFYFPSYELVIDDLRDYRFYAEDMVHPNYQATAYVWEKFVASFISENSQKYMKEIEKLVFAKNHRAFNPNSEAHQKFLSSHLQKTTHLEKIFPFLNWEEEKTFFGGGKLS